MECRPTFLGAFRDGLLASSTHLALRFCRGCFGRRFGFALGCSPTFPLCITDALPGGGTHIPALAFWNFGLGYRLSGATGQHGSEVGNLTVNPARLGLEAFDGGGDDVVCEFWCGHVSLSQPFTLPQFFLSGQWASSLRIFRSTLSSRHTQMTVPCGCWYGTGRFKLRGFSKTQA